MGDWVTVAVRNLSTVVPNIDLWDAQDAFMRQVNIDVAWYWPQAHRVRELRILDVDAGEVRRPGEWLFEIYDNADDALAANVKAVDLTDIGYHIMTDDCPYMIILAEDAETAGFSWTVPFSHELVECLVDPTCEATYPNSAYVLEICDQVWQQAYPITDNNVWVSNFVLPSWFQPGVDGPYDFLSNLAAPLELPLGGYMSTKIGGKETTKRMTVCGLVTVSEDDTAKEPAPLGSTMWIPRARLRRPLSVRKRLLARLRQELESGEEVAV